MSHKVEQVESTLHRAIAEVIRRGLSDPRTEGSLIGVTRVNVSPDLRNATVYVSVLPEAHGRRVLAALTHAVGFIHTEVKKRVALRIVPRLTFRFDEKLQKQNAVLGAISEAIRRTGDSPAPDAEAPADDPAGEPH
jgi:ribosome-binding factor A